MRIFRLILPVILLVSCHSETIYDAYNIWIGKEVVFPASLYSFSWDRDSIRCQENHNWKILLYTDLIGCVSCKLQPKHWQVLNDEISLITQNSIETYIFLGTTQYDLKTTMRHEGYRHPVCIDKNDSLNKLNHFPKDDRFRCFLLDENNRVILIGNPVQNPKIKDLYIRTICERLGIEYVHNPDENPRISLGTIKKDEPKNVCFEIRNDGDATMQIDTIFTSCECTTAKIDRMQIPRNETAILSVTYTPDGAGDFVRDAYVKVNGKEQPKIFTIEGTVK